MAACELFAMTHVCGIDTGRGLTGPSGPSVSDGGCDAGSPRQTVG